jgi:Phage integrase, N-terminal SAM-like domain
MSATVPAVTTSPTQPPRLLDQFRAAARVAGHPEPWIEPLTSWVTAFVIFHGKRHPRELDSPARDAFLRHVVQTRKDPRGALAAARSALQLLYEAVLLQSVGELSQPRPPRLLDQLRQVLRLGHYLLQTEKCYVQWATRFILFHGERRSDFSSRARNSSSTGTIGLSSGGNCCLGRSQ